MGRKNASISFLAVRRTATEVRSRLPSTSYPESLVCAGRSNLFVLTTRVLLERICATQVALPNDLHDLLVSPEDSPRLEK